MSHRCLCAFSWPALLDKRVLKRRIVEYNRQDLEVCCWVDLSQDFDHQLSRDKVRYVVAEHLPLLGGEMALGELFADEEESYNVHQF
jgi:hypothetical protein